MQNPVVAKRVEAQMMKAAKLIESHVDEEIEKLDKLSEDDLDTLRKKRLAEMKKTAKLRDEYLAAGHGRYFEVASEREFFDECKSSKNIVCHFSRDVTMRCQIVDRHMPELARKHVECKFMKLNAEKAPFLTQRLNIYVIPSILIIRDEKVVDCIVGFDDLGGHDDFSTRMLEWRIATSKAISYNGDINQPPDMEQPQTKKSMFKEKKEKKKIIRGNENEEHSSDDNDWE